MNSRLRLLAQGTTAFFLALGIGYGFGTNVTADEYVVADFTVALGSGATPGEQTHMIDDPDNPGEQIEVPILDGKIGGGDETKIDIGYGQVAYESSDEASANDNIRIDGRVEEPETADIRWHVRVFISHDHLARIVNGPGNANQGSYASHTEGISSVSFLIRNQSNQTVVEVDPDSKSYGAVVTSDDAGEDTEVKTHKFGVPDPTDPDNPNPDILPHVLQMQSDSDKAKLTVTLYGQVSLNAVRPEVEVGGHAKIAIESGSFIKAYDHTNPDSDPVLLKQQLQGGQEEADDAEWDIE